MGAAMSKVPTVLEHYAGFLPWKQNPPWVKKSPLEVASLRGSSRSRLSVERTGVLSLRDGWIAPEEGQDRIPQPEHN